MLKSSTAIKRSICVILNDHGRWLSLGWFEKWKDISESSYVQDMIIENREDARQFLLLRHKLKVACIHITNALVYKETWKGKCLYYYLHSIFHHFHMIPSPLVSHRNCLVCKCQQSNHQTNQSRGYTCNTQFGHWFPWFLLLLNKKNNRDQSRRYCRHNEC